MNYLLVLLGGLQISDGVMTDFLVRNSVVQESNRLMDPLVRDGSFLVLKIIGALACVVALKLLAKRFSRTAFLTCSAAAVFYFAVITWNIGTVLA